MKQILILIFVFVCIFLSSCNRKDKIWVRIFPKTECGVMFIYGNNGNTNTQILVRGDFNKSDFLETLSKLDTVKNGIKFAVRNQFKYSHHEQAIKFTNDSLYQPYTHGLADIYVVPVCLKYRKREFPDIYFDPTKVEYLAKMKLDGHKIFISSYYSEDLILSLKVRKW